MREGYRGARRGASGAPCSAPRFPREPLPIYAACTKPLEAQMAHKFWRGAYSGGSADGRYDGPDAGAAAAAWLLLVG